MKNTIIRAIWFFIIVYAFSIKSVFAYIDPGTAGMVIGSVGGSIWPLIVGFFAAIGSFLMLFIKPIKKRITSLWRTIKKTK